MSYRNEHDIEKRNVRAIVKAALANQWFISVNDGEEWTIKQSKDYNVINQALFTTDEDILLLRDNDGVKIGTIYLVYGNDPDEVVSDYGASKDNFASFEAFLDPIIDSFETGRA